MNDMIFDNPTIDKEHHLGNGVQRIYEFDNGIHVSIVRFLLPFMMHDGSFYGSYTENDNQWELMVIEFGDFDRRMFKYSKDKILYDLYLEPIGYLDKNDVEKILRKLKNLTKKKLRVKTTKPSSLSISDSDDTEGE